MIGTAEFPGSQLLSDLSAFLRHPVVDLRLCSSDDVARLEERVRSLEAENEELRQRCRSLEMKYGQEVCIALRLQDICRMHGISYR